MIHLSLIGDVKLVERRRSRAVAMDRGGYKEA